jgi:anti-anti-sigma factor
MLSGAEGRAMDPTLYVCPGVSGTIVRIEGEIDVCVADRLQELLLRIMRAHGPRLLLDLSAVSFIDCAGLRAVTQARRHAELCGWSMHLIAASAMTRRIITLTGMEGALPVRDQDLPAVAVLPGSRTPIAITASSDLSIRVMWCRRRPRQSGHDARQTRTRGDMMKTDGEIREDVIDELRWDPQVTDPEAIGVAVRDGAVTLTGHVPTYVEKLAAARAAERVYGVKAVANELEVKLAGAPRDDSDIATAIAHVLDNNVQVPPGRVHARVQNGWVTLDGEVDYDYQRREVERMVRQVRGVTGVSDLITVKPPASPQAVKAKIEEAFKREAEIDARHVSIEVSDHTAKLYGHVHSLNEASAAKAAAAAAPGIAAVESHLVVSP